MINIILHIGPPKTGTTSLQSFFSLAQSELLSDTILYPSNGRMREGVSYQIKRRGNIVCKTGPDNAHHLLAWTLSGAAKNISADHCWASVLNEIDSIQPKTAILSSEDFAWLSDEQIYRMKELLSGYSVKVVIYFREELRWLLSRYAQNVKVGAYHQSFRAFMNQKYPLNYISYEFLIKRYADVFGEENIELKLFDKIKEQTSLEKDLILMLGGNPIKYAKFLKSDRKNISPSSEVISMIRMLNLIQHYFGQKIIPVEYFERARNSIIRQGSVYKRLHKIARPVFNKPLYTTKDARLLDNLVEEWLPDILSKYLSPEDQMYYKNHNQFNLPGEAAVVSWKATE